MSDTAVRFVAGLLIFAVWGAGMLHQYGAWH